ncbi:zinc finger CCCH domain-containing protein 11A-like, partial [Phasianus colchicus]|uniref:zinc finger CCCH domain-containing protein 11A-like n=1 Tax=Phasianus colchicus TaxID=9054 RepID=UPI00129DA1C1
MEAARPWNGAGHGGKRKASAEADASGLPLKRSHAERQRRSTECDMAPKREIGAEPNGNICVKVVQQVCSERACHRAAAEAPLQAGGLPRRAGPSTGGRPSPAVCPHSDSKAQAGCKRKGLEEGRPTAAQLPAKKRARGQSGDSVPAPAAQPGPAAARSSRQRGEQ